MMSTETLCQTLGLVTRSPEETEQLGERLGMLLQSGYVLCLSGELGTGKTCLARGLARGWGAQERPTSPTFTLVNEYRRPADTQRFYHIDCYRISSAAEAQTIGLEDILAASGVVVIEWPEHIVDALPVERLWIQINDMGGDNRELILQASGDWATDLLRSFQGQG